MIPETTHPFNLHPAFLRVEASRGMAGVDGVTLGAYRRYWDCHLALQGKTGP